MQFSMPNDIPVGLRAWMVSLLILLVLPVNSLMAADLVGLYVGGAVGESRVSVNSQGFALENFEANHVAFQLTAGIRPLPWVGAELDYIDFGHLSGTLDELPASVTLKLPASATLKGAAAFGVVYLPVPVIDIYAKAGLARLQTTLNGATAVQTLCIPCRPSLFRLDQTNTDFAAGAGAQHKFGAFALRAEYEYFSSPGSGSHWVSLGATWTFL
jgi:hypothetical protein